VYKSPLSAKNIGYYDLVVLGQGTPDAGDQSIALAISAKGLKVKGGCFQISTISMIAAVGLCGNFQT
jgi:hypothetical protein